MSAQRSLPQTPGAARAGLCLSTFFPLVLACTPFGGEPEDTISPAGLDDPDSTQLEPIYAPLPDDDQEDPVVVDDEDPRCWKDARPDQAWEIADPNADPEAGMMGVEHEGKVLALPLQHTSFDTVVVGTVAETEIVQTFANPFDEPIEAVYMFPLHERAAVDDYWLTIGERTIRGQMKTREEARATYEDAKREGKAAGLLEQQRPNIFTQNVANIPPGESIEVSIHLVQPLEQEAGKFSLVLPTVVGPRFIPGDPVGHSGPGPVPDTDRVPDASKITAPVIPEGYTSCADIEVHVAVEAGMRPRALRSKFHAVDIQREGDVAFVELDTAAGPVVANRDFILSWDLGQNQPQAALITQPLGKQDRAQDEGEDEDFDDYVELPQPPDFDGYFTLTVQPPEQVADEQATPRELIFVVDNSGSMGGKPMATAKALMHEALDGMRPDDSFAVLRFSESASRLSKTLLSATKANRERGHDYVDDMEGMGGTHMLAGIRAALDMPHDPDRLRVVMFLTDGYIGNEMEIFELLEDEVGDARLFALGVGGAPNRYLLDGMSRVGRGAVTYAGQDEDVDPVVDRFYARISTPVLTDIEIDWQGLAVSEVLPGKIPDLFTGQPLTVFGRYQGQPSGEVVVRGQARGETVEIPVRFEVAKATNFEGLSSVWARNKIDDLLGYPFRPASHLEVVGDEKKQVVALALEHRIMTEFTSFVAVSEVQVVEKGTGETRTILQPVEAVEGMSPDAVAASYGVGGLGLVGRGAGGGGTGSGYGRGSGAGFGGTGKRVPRVRTGQAKVRGSIDKDVIRRVVRAHKNEIRGCYNATLARDPNASGRIVIRFVIDPDGTISEAKVASDEVGDAKLGACVAKQVKGWTFPRPAGGGPIVIKYPFRLSPG